MEHTREQKWYEAAYHLRKAGKISLSKGIYWSLEFKNRSALTANNLATYYKEENEDKYYKRCIKLYEKSLHRKENVKAACSLAELYFKKERFDEAIKFYNLAYKRKKNPQILYNLGIVLFYNKNYVDASKRIKEAMVVLPKGYQYDALIALIYMYSKIGNSKKAREYFYALIEKYSYKDLDLLHLAYACEAYEFIDTYCFSLLRECIYSKEDAKLVFVVLKRMGKDKVAHYFLERLLEEMEESRRETEQFSYHQIYCNVMEIEEPTYEPILQLHIIKHKPMYQ